MKKGYIIIFFILLADGCVEPLDVPVLDRAKILVVDGMITDQDGPQTVHLFYSSSLDENIKTPVPATDAFVTIEDGLGNIETLTEGDDGTYETSPSYHGTIGNSYTLKITTEDGKKYESKSATMKSAGSIDKVEHQLRENVVNNGDLTKPQDAVYFFIDGTASSQTNLLRWRWTATYYVHTYPELATKTDMGVKVPAPLPCSVPICICCECWPDIKSNSVSISQPQNRDDITFGRQFLGYIQLEEVIFFNRVIIVVEQLSVQEDVYHFWTLVKTQTEGAGNIFQPNIVKVTGNMRCVDQPDEKVFGIFSVSAVVRTEHNIYPGDLPKLVLAPDSVFSDCRLYYHASNQMPSFW